MAIVILCECVCSHTPHTPCTIACVLPTSVKQRSTTSITYFSHYSTHPSPISLLHTSLTNHLLHSSTTCLPSTFHSTITSLLSTTHSPITPSPSTPPHSPNLVQPLHVKLFLCLYVPLLTGPQLVCGTNKSKLFTLLPGGAVWTAGGNDWCECDDEVDMYQTIYTRVIMSRVRWRNDWSMS